MSARYSHIDIAKGLGILAVVGLHSGFHVNAWIGWEMPLFFFLSGIFTPPLPNKNFLKSKINRLLVPACFFYSPILLYNCIYYVMNFGKLSLVDCFKNCAIPTALWFLIALFYISVMYWAVKTVIKSQIGLIFVAVVALVMGYLLSYWQVPQIAFMNTSITSLFFYLLGNIFSSKIKGLGHVNKWISLLLGSCLLVGSQFLYEVDHCYIFYRNNELNAPIYMVAIIALSGIVGVLYLSNFLSHIKVISVGLSYFGENSLVILCVHLYVWKFIQFLHFPNWIQFVTITGCMIPSIWFLKRFCPKLSGYQPFF